MADDVEIEMDPMDLRRPAPGAADTDRARARDLRAQVLKRAQDDASQLGLDDSHTEEWAAAKAQLAKAQESLAMRATEATTLMNRRDERLAKAAEAEANGDHAAAAEFREGAALADAQFQGYVTTVAIERSRVEALTQDVNRLDAWSDAAIERATRSTELLGAAENEVDDLEDRAQRLTQAELHERTASTYAQEAQRLEAQGNTAEARALWDRANDEIARADAARQEAATFEVDEAAIKAAGLRSEPPDDVTGAGDPPAPDRPSGDAEQGRNPTPPPSQEQPVPAQTPGPPTGEPEEIEMPPEDMRQPSQVEEPAASMDDFSEPPADAVAGSDDLGFDDDGLTFEG